jgi:Peptidogalycan biosysnthesis/recognition
VVAAASAALPKSVESDYVASSHAATRADARFCGGRCAVVPISLGTVRIASRSEIESLPGWRSAFAGERKDRRYYELIEDTLGGFAFGYLLVEEGELRAVQPFFVVDQDLVTGAEGSIQRIVGWVRRFWPRFLFARTLMVGCAAGEGHLDGPDEASQSRIAKTLARSLNRIGRDLKCAMVVLKEFPTKYRAPLSCLPRSGFARIPSMPMTTLSLEYKNFDAYLSANLSAATRGKIRRKLRDAERAKPAISMSVEQDATPFVEEIYPLYLDVYERSPLKFEKLTKEFLNQIGNRMPDKVRFFLWRQDNRIIAFGLCTIVGENLCHEYVGFDYAVAFELNLYYRVFHDIIEWAIANGYKRFYSGSLNYDPKWHLRQSLYPIDLYVRHTSGPVNILFRRLLPLLEPTRSEPILPNFANYRELWE